MRVLSTSAHLLLSWSLLQHAEAASSAATTSSSSSNFIHSLSSSSSNSINTSPMIPRFLEENAYNYYSGNYHLVFDKCIRVKIPKNNDDDGNSYFYNGAYRSQSMAFASFFLCPSDNGCGQYCDTTTAYVTDLEDYLQAYVQHLQNYCTACQEKCRRRRNLNRQRRADEGGDGDGYNINIDCYECADQCSLLNGSSNNNGDAKDESQYLECQEAYQDENGIVYYSAPTCSNTGRLEMGLFYDEDCTIKKSDDDSGFRNTFGYKTFQTVENWCTYCDNNDNNDGGDNDICNADGGFMQDAYQCVDGQNVNENVEEEDAEMNICKTYKKVSKEWQYAQAKKKSPWPIIISVLVLVNVFLFLSYTYYVRHVKTAEQIAAANGGGGGDGTGNNDSNNNIDPSAGAIDTSDEPKAAYAQLT